MLPLDSGLPRVIDDCHGLLRWLIPLLACAGRVVGTCREAFYRLKGGTGCVSG